MEGEGKGEPEMGREDRRREGERERNLFIVHLKVRQ